MYYVSARLRSKLAVASAWRGNFENFCVVTGRKTESEKILAFKQGSFHERRVLQHRRQGVFSGHIAAVRFRNPAPRQATSIQKLLPFDSAAPQLEHLHIETVFTQVVEFMLNRMIQ